MRRKLLFIGDREGIHPVVATVIIVAVSIAIAIAVALWATGLVGTFTRYEKLEITAIYYDGTNVQVIVNNTGSTDVTITDVFVNGIPDNSKVSSPAGTLPFTVAVGGGQQITISGPPSSITSGNWQSGITYEVTVHTASGKDYPKSVTIP